MPKIRDQQKPAMKKFRLLESIHVEPDWKAEPVPLDNGEPDPNWRRPSIQYARGQTVVSPTDLVAKFGSNKFQYVGTEDEGPVAMRSGGHQGAPSPGDPVPDIANTSPAHFPGGQVSTGLQVTTTGPDGKPVSGPMNAENEPNAVVDEETGGRKLGQKANVFGKPQPGAGREKERTPSSPRAPRPADTDEAGKGEEAATPKYSRDELDDKTMAELRDMAEEEEIDLAGARTKEDVIQRLVRGR